MGSVVKKDEGFYPSIQETVSNNSKRSQNIHFSLVFLNLTLLVVAAFLSKFKFSYFDFRFNQTILLVVGFVILIYLGAKKPERVWYSSRSLSETIKTLSWRFCFLSAPFGSSEKADSELLVERIKESCMESNFVDGFSSKYTVSTHPTPEMLHVRQLPIEDKASLYLTKRVGEQLKWYLAKAGRNRVLSKCVFSLLCLASATAVVLSLVNELSASAQMPTDVVIALSSSLIAWMQTRKYVELTAAYELTAYEIDRARSLVHSISTPSELERFVDEMENLFSREHTQWIAKRQA